MRTSLKKNTLDLSIVIPTLNEAPNLYRLIPRLKEALEALNIHHEILIVDADSQDGTEKTVNDAGATYICETDPGYGRAILRGVSEAKGTYVLTMDADLSHPADFVKSLWAVREDADITIASRYVPGGYADQPWTRLMLSKILNLGFSKGLAIDIKDLSSGYRLYRKSIFSRLELDLTNFVLLIDILLRAHANGFIVQEIPFHYEPRGSGSSKARVIKFGFDYLKLFIRVWRIRNSVDFPDYDWRAHNSRIWLQRYWQRTRYKIIMRFVDKAVPTCDIGCGSSHILADLPHAVGVDLRHDKLAFMRKTNAFLVQGDGMCLPFDDDQFDCVISSEVIEHIPEENGTHIDECTRILKPGGTLVLGTPDYDRWEWVVLEWLYNKVRPDAYCDEHVTFYTYDSLSKALIDRGYDILEHDYVGRGELIFKARKAASVKAPKSSVAIEPKSTAPSEA